MTSALPSIDAAAESARTRRAVYALIIVVWGALALAGILAANPLQSANDRSRWCTVWSLATRGSYQIDEIIARRGWDTIDKVRHEGHFYSSKPALLPTIVAGGYWLILRTTGWDILKETELVCDILLCAINLLPMLIALALIARLVERHARTDFARYFLMLTAAFGTFLSTFSVTFNNHTIAATSIVFAVYAATRILHEDAGRPLHFVVAGLFGAFASTNELPSALFGVLLFALLFRADPRRTLLYFVPAAIVPLAAFFYTTYLQTGGWKPFYMYFGTEKYNYTVNGVPSYWSDPKGIDRSVDTLPAYLFHTTFGHHGIWSLSPVFLLSVASWIGLATRRAEKRTPWLASGLFLTVTVLAFYLTRTDSYNYGGNSAGLRWMFWLIPFWLLAAIPTLDRCGEKGWFRTLSAALLAVSAFSAAYPLANPWQQPWLYAAMQSWGWIDYSEPPPKLSRPVTSWIAKVPTGTANGAKLEFTGYDVDGQPIRMALSDGGRPESGGTDLRVLRIERSWVADSKPITLVLNTAALASGKPVEEVLVSIEGDSSDAARADVLSFLRGVPAPASYVAARPVYLFTHLRQDAFRCERAVAQAYVTLPNEGGRLRHRCDAWLSDEVPFGVVRVMFSISDPATGATLGQRMLTAERAAESNGT